MSTEGRNFNGARRAATAGFTLIELLVVMAVMGVVTTLGVQTFIGITSAWSVAKTQSEMDAAAYDVFESIRRDFEDILSANLSGVSVRGIDRTTTDQSYFQRILEDDQVIIPVQNSGAAPGQRRLKGGTVGYRVMRSEGMHRLVRTVGDLSPTAFPIGGTTPIIKAYDVIRFELEFLSGDSEEGWVNEWIRPEHPAVVRVSLTLADPDSKGVQISRKAVFPVHVE